MSTGSSKHTPRPVSSTTTYALAAVAVVLIGVIVFAFVAWSRDVPATRNDGYGTVKDPAVTVTVADGGVVRLGKPDAAKTIDFYEDPLCPGCGAQERIHGQEIAQKIDEGKLAVRYHFVAFLDDQSRSKDYSTRAVAANLCVAQAGSAVAYGRFHEALFVSNQPREGGDDHSDAELADLAKQAGASDAAVQCVTSGAQRAAAATAVATQFDELGKRLDGRVSTPSVFDGTIKIDVSDENWVTELAP
ncbi:DsbA family protein [Nocardia thailandica]|uniref:DsbA family protein n=1 Tax=Nocardia thailandica TaxID=257275 RepID=UPI0002F80F0B|nr:thioredoxin domain-containing protein [Nocardia thailandica]